MAYIQTIIVMLIVAGAALFLVRRFYGKLKKGNASPSCGCGCSGCQAAQSCQNPDDSPGDGVTS